MMLYSLMAQSCVDLINTDRASVGAQPYAQGCRVDQTLPLCPRSSVRRQGRDLSHSDEGTSPVC